MALCSALPNSSLFKFAKAWQSIPETIIINLILFILFLVLFISLRKIAWRKKHVKGWLQSIYGDRKLATKGLLAKVDNPIIHHNPIETDSRMRHYGYQETTTISEHPSQPNRTFPIQQQPSSMNYDTLTINTNDPSPRRQSNETSFDFNKIPSNLQATFAEVGYKLSDVLLISNADIRESRGNDAYQYLLFQQYIIYYLAILTIFCMFVVLPVNIFGDSGDTNVNIFESFHATTIKNLNDKSYYWIHVCGASIMGLIGVFNMHQFTKRIRLDDEQITRRTLLIRRVPKPKRDKELIANYFHKVIPNCEIEGIQSLYNVRNLAPLTNELINLDNARCFCREYMDLNGKRLQIRPAACGEFGCLVSPCCSSCQKVDGLEFYETKKEELHKLIAAETAKAASHPSDGFFITFRTERMAQEAFVHLKRKQERLFSFCPFSRPIAQMSIWCRRLANLPETDELNVGVWMVNYAPYPDDINWCDLTVNLKRQWVRSILLNFLALILFMFFSTPSVIMKFYSSHLKENQKFYQLYNNSMEKILRLFETDSKIIPDLISPLILIVAASALPAIVTLTCQYIAYISLSAKNNAIMWKVYLFLIFMVIIWPPITSTSIGIWLLNLIKEKHNDEMINWECLFGYDNNNLAFFFNYTIQSAFIGNIMELMRIPELIIYLWYMATARSRAEVDTASRYVVWDFGIGIRYPRFLLIFAMVVTYSLSCPLITLAGLVYMIIKHLIDRYNIYYVYNPSKINSKIHSTAITFVHIAFLMMQAQLFTVTYVQARYTPVFAMSLIALVVSILIFSGHFFFQMFRNLNHLTYRATRKRATTQREYCACSFLPPILYNSYSYTMKRCPSSLGSNLAALANESVGNQPANGTIGQGGKDQNQRIQSGKTLNGGAGNGPSRLYESSPNNSQYNGAGDHEQGSNTVTSATSITQATTVDMAGLGSSQNLLNLPSAIDTSDAYFLSGANYQELVNSGKVLNKFGRHTITPSTSKLKMKSRRTASDGQQLFQQNRLVPSEQSHGLKRTNSDIDNVM